MYDIYYIGGQNSERIDFCQWPYMVTGGDLFDGDYDEIEENDHIQRFERKITDYSLNIEINAVGETFRKAIDFLEEVTEKDIINVTPGKLYVGDSYLKCWIVGTEKDRWVNDLNSISNKLTIRSDYPFWISETTYNFYSYDTILSSNNKNYPGRYAYRYANGLSNAYIQNPHFANSNFDLIIYGPVVNPQVIIGETPYLVNIVLDTGEYLKIDSRAGTVTKVMVNGEIVNAFHNRQKGRQFFKKIPPGRHVVAWTGTFAWDIILYEERSEPKWNVSQQQ